MSARVARARTRAHARDGLFGSGKRGACGVSGRSRVAGRAVAVIATVPGLAATSERAVHGEYSRVK